MRGQDIGAKPDRDRHGFVDNRDHDLPRKWYPGVGPFQPDAFRISGFKQARPHLPVKLDRHPITRSDSTRRCNMHPSVILCGPPC